MKKDVIAIRVKANARGALHEFGACIVTMASALNELWNDASKKGLINRYNFVEVETKSVGESLLDSIAEFLNCDVCKISASVEIVKLDEAE